MVRCQKQAMLRQAIESRLPLPSVGPCSKAQLSCFIGAIELLWTMHTTHYVHFIFILAYSSLSFRDAAVACWPTDVDRAKVASSSLDESEMRARADGYRQGQDTR